MLDQLVEKLKIQNPDLNKAEIEGVLQVIFDHDELSNNELVQKTGIPKETLRKFKESISNLLENTSGDSLVVSSSAREMFFNEIFKPYRWSLVDYQNPDVEEKLSVLRNHGSLKAKRELDQFFATNSTSYAKAQILLDRGLSSGNSIALLGDDDLVSITLAIMGIKDIQIHVFDLDKDILRFIDTVSKEMGFVNVFTHSYDVREELSQKFCRSFDAVMMDPPYTRAGVSLFLQRARELLRQQKDLSCNKVFMFYGNSFKVPEKHYKIQVAINELGFVIEEKISKFASYVGAESIGSRSDLYILKKFNDDAIVNSYSENRIYTYDKLKEEKFPFVDHFVFKIYGVAAKSINSKNTLQKTVGEFCNLHKLKVMGTNIVKFAPHGFTVSVVLANSNLTLHTWPEFNAVHVDLVVCSPIYNKEQITLNLQKLFAAEYIESKRVE